jgi:phage replication-related protein YjqB (UPF0714/DUF867 family)
MESLITHRLPCPARRHFPGAAIDKTATIGLLTPHQIVLRIHGVQDAQQHFHKDLNEDK